MSRKNFTYVVMLVQAVVLEGKYWKRRLLCVTTEYMKWRQYYKNKTQQALHSSTHPHKVVVVVVVVIVVLVVKVKR